MPRLPEKLLLLALLAALAVGCKPEIGDDCQISTDCSAAGDRLCDITAPGGYCTVYNCEPGACPEDESLCVQFGTERSPNAACSNPQSASPYARTFCMAVCEADDDCRDGYVCASLTGANEWNAILIDTDRGGKACLVPISAEPVGDDAETAGVCHAEAPGASGGSSNGGSSSGGSSNGGSSSGGTTGSAGEPGASGMAGAGVGGGAAGAADGGAGG